MSQKTTPSVSTTKKTIVKKVVPKTTATNAKTTSAVKKTTTVAKKETFDLFGDGSYVPKKTEGKTKVSTSNSNSMVTTKGVKVYEIDPNNISYEEEQEVLIYAEGIDNALMRIKFGDFPALPIFLKDKTFVTPFNKVS